MPNVPKDIIDSLITLAETQTSEEKCSSFLEGKSDVDAYCQGVEDGEIHSARQFLARMGVDYTIRKEEG